MQEQNSKVVPQKIFENQLDAFINALYSELVNRSTGSSWLDWLTQSDANTLIEGNKEYLGEDTINYLLAFKALVNEYELHNSYQDEDDKTEPPTVTNVEVDYEKESDVWENGYFELINKETRGRIVVELNCEVRSSFIKVSSVKDSGENQKFLDKLREMAKSFDIYRNKTFILKSTNMGLIPKFIKVSERTREDVVLPQNVWDEVESNCINVFEDNQRYHDLKIPTKRGILFEGPPGNGKSSLIACLNNVLDGKVTFIYVTDGVIHSANDIARIFTLARRYNPAVLVFEDIDVIGRERQMGGQNFTCELLAQLDGLEVLQDLVIIATTNHVDLVDEALKNRPSRFDRRISVPKPEAEFRARLLTKFLTQKNIAVDAETIKQVASKTKEYNGAHLQEIVVTAQLLALRQEEVVGGAHLLQAVDFLTKQFSDNINKIGDSASSFGFRG